MSASAPPAAAVPEGAVSAQPPAEPAGEATRASYDAFARRIGESGIITDTPAHRRISVRFYLTAMLFIIFDVEAIFFYPWAVLLHQLKWFGLIEMFVFIGILLVALAHVWRKGGLDWE